MNETDGRSADAAREGDPERPLSSPRIGIVCALPEELGNLRRHVTRTRVRHGLELLELDVDGHPAFACVSGVGKVMAARSAALLLEAGATRALLVVGTCGGLRQHLAPGALVHCSTAAQVDLASRHFREMQSNAAWREAWTRVVPGHSGWFLTADRPVLSWWRRLRLARAFAGPCVADMETAAVAAVAEAAGVPWAALRAVTDRATLGGVAAFHLNFAVQAGRAADTIAALLREMHGPPV